MKALIKNNFFTSIFICLFTFISLFSLIACNDTKLEQKQDYDMSGITFEDKTVTYDGNEHEILIEGTLPEGVTVTYENNKLTEVGSVKATAIFSHNNPNYNEIPNMTATLTVEENPLYHTVKFIISDNEFKEVLVKEGEWVKLEDIPNIPSKTGYNGVWDKDISCITEDIEVYVKYTPKEYTITYIPNGGEIESLTQKVVYDQAFTLYDIERKGYTFLGYTYNDNKFESGIWNIDKDITLEAKWQANTYRITYMLNNEVIYYEDVLFGENYTLYEYITEEYDVVAWINNGKEVSPNVKTTLNEDNDIVYVGKCAYISDDFNYSITNHSIANNKAEITGYNGYDLDVRIPDYIKDNKIYYQVTSIGEYAFYGCSSLTSVKIPEGVTSIGDDAFSGCRSLESITIPEGVTSIGNNAFDGCRSLESITIPEGVTSIGNGAFVGCSSLESITIPEGVTSMGDYAFLNCRSLESVTILEGVTSIGWHAFDGCSSLESVTIPNSVKEIDDTAFRLCSKLNYVYYKGTADEWNNINGSNNIFKGNVYYYSETEPITSGNYWHYDVDGITPVIWNKN